MINWSNQYRTGIEHLDNQHKKLFEYINDLESKINSGDTGPELMADALEFFERYTKMHFGNEEECMYRHHCPIAIINQEAHQQFIEFFEECRNEIDLSDYDERILRNVMAYVEDWIKQHICVIDTQLNDCVKQ